MRLYLLSFLLASALLASCNPEPSAGPRVALVGSSRFLSASRSSTVPGDTFSTRVFADKYDPNDADLSRLLITVEYIRSRNPYVYPSTGFEANDVPNDAGQLIFLDSVLTGEQQQSVAVQFQAGTRTTSGREIWRFKADDVDGESNEGGFTLRLRNADSLLTYHRYTTILPAPISYQSRSYISLLSGLALPSFSLRQHPENQSLIDLVYLPLPNGGRALATPQDPTFTNRSTFWTNRRATKLRATALDSAAFTAATTPAQLEAAFAAPNGTLITSTGALPSRGAGRVFAFQTADSPAKTGLVFVQSIITVPTPAIRMQVRITK
ncbi:hypothetical protein J0X19_23220 [Hymenobacter sp. BT186]|uniref:DUF4270 family protein n=1 Tax=Hymenobacter telluris TaxID=2816474 RepID=A0A939F2G8_9BACT|nr:hypothetical protein [Hymenobacter telluris]MBO0360890.1 hypothetical protein [Hymenobacter telluris]MBW3376919.1 hypothetical protein [Hymenobacter norwichensis]